MSDAPRVPDADLSKFIDAGRMRSSSFEDWTDVCLDLRDARSKLEALAAALRALADRTEVLETDLEMQRVRAVAAEELAARAAEKLGAMDCRVAGLTEKLAEAEERAARLQAGLERIRDCDWVITLPDRMDAVREIAREALEGAAPKGLWDVPRGDPNAMSRAPLAECEPRRTELEAKLAAAEAQRDRLTREVERWKDSETALRGERRKLRRVLGQAMQYGIELGTADPAWVAEARAALSATDGGVTPPYERCTHCNEAGVDPITAAVCAYCNGTTMLERAPRGEGPPHD